MSQPPADFYRYEARLEALSFDPLALATLRSIRALCADSGVGRATRRARLLNLSWVCDYIAKCDLSERDLSELDAQIEAATVGTSPPRARGVRDSSNE